MPVEKSDSNEQWQPKHNDKWHKVPLDSGTGDVKVPTGGVDPFDPKDPESDWGAYKNRHGHLVVPCGDGLQTNFADLYPSGPTTDRHVHGAGEACTGGRTETDVQVEVTERSMWFRDFRCSFVVETSMTWKVTKQKYACVPEGDVVGPNVPGTWQKDGNETVDSVSKSRRTEFKCC